MLWEEEKQTADGEKQDCGALFGEDTLPLGQKINKQAQSNKEEWF